MEDCHLLTYEEAKGRSAMISNVHYTLSMVLTKEETFTGECQITFTSASAGSSWLEFKCKSVSSLQINSTPVDASWDNWKLLLPGLQEGANTVDISFENRYVNDGLGLHRYKDPEDDSVYLYTQFEPFAANKMFPCFDQPDLKAVLDFTVTAPSDWLVISNEIATSKTEEGQAITHKFAPTAKLSTYLYVLCAGPYAEYRNDGNEVGIPMGIYCRKTLAKYMRSEIYFHWTVEGLKFYNAFFGFKYPFGKYDQVFVPEFNAGAMENAGCVTYRDQYVFRDPPSHVQLTRVCDTFLHEMAHMWFGDLVTMKWWDDLWLNESFATFMSHLCVWKQLPTEYPNVWIEFLGLKGWGYATDQLQTTHPISTPVKDTDETESNFDGISYAKGSSVLKQLYFLVGHAAFEAAMQKYMQRFSFQNAEFNDLIQFIAAEAGDALDINSWAESWVRTTGLNELEPVLAYDESGKITSFSIKQTPALPEHPTLRFHKLVVEAFDSSGTVVKHEEVSILPQEMTEVPSFVGVECACVLLNVEDWAYCKIRIDERSISFLQENLPVIKDPLSKQLIWRALYDMVRDIKLPAIKFIEFAIKQLPLETDPSIANYGIEISSPALYNYIKEGPAKDRLAHAMFEAILEKIRGASSATEGMIYQKKLLGYCHTLSDIEVAVEWVKNKDTGIEGYTLGQLDRWSIIKKYAENSTNAQELLEAELAVDSSDSGHLSKLYCEAAFPTAESKAASWEKFVNSSETMSRYERENSMIGFNRGRQTELLMPYFESYFEKAVDFLKTKDREVSKDFCEFLIPNYVDNEHVIEKLNLMINQVPAERFDIIRMLKETVDMLSRFARGKALSEEYLSSQA